MPALRRIARAVLTAALAFAVGAPALAAKSPGKPPKPTSKRKETKPRDYAKTLAVLKTSQGDITVRFFYDKAPNHVKNFVDLAAAGFYDGTLFHRVIPGFVIQGGDPNTKDPKKESLYGLGGATDRSGAAVTLKAEFNEVRHTRGILSMARSSDPDSASSQFFIVVQDAPTLDRAYTAFGEVVSGMEVVDKIVAESQTDMSNPQVGKPRSYQKLIKVQLTEEKGEKSEKGN